MKKRPEVILSAAIASRPCRRAGEPLRGDTAARCQRGFSLLEILVAFSILALTLGVLLRIFGGGVRASSLADEHAQAVQFAESLLARVGTETPVLPGETRGELDDRYRWVLRITPYVPQDQLFPEKMPVKPFWIEARVEWGEEDEYHDFTLGTLRLAGETDPLGRRPR